MVEKFKTPIIVIVIVIGALLVVISAFLKIQKLEIASILLLISMIIEILGIALLIFQYSRRKKVE